MQNIPGEIPSSDFTMEGHPTWVVKQRSRPDYLTNGCQTSMWCLSSFSQYATTNHLGHYQYPRRSFWNVCVVYNPHYASKMMPNAIFDSRLYSSGPGWVSTSDTVTSFSHCTLRLNPANEWNEKWEQRKNNQKHNHHQLNPVWPHHIHGPLVQCWRRGDVVHFVNHESLWKPWVRDMRISYQAPLCTPSDNWEQARKTARRWSEKRRPNEYSCQMYRDRT